jgi:hypothetical protein
MFVTCFTAVVLFKFFWKFQDLEFYEKFNILVSESRQDQERPPIFYAITMAFNLVLALVVSITYDVEF